MTSKEGKCYTTVGSVTWVKIPVAFVQPYARDRKLVRLTSDSSASSLSLYRSSVVEESMIRIARYKNFSCPLFPLSLGHRLLCVRLTES